MTSRVSKASTGTRSLSKAGHLRPNRVRWGVEHHRLPTTVLIVLGLIAAAIVLVVLLCPITSIGPIEVGLVTKKFGPQELSDDNIIGFEGEAG